MRPHPLVLCLSFCLGLAATAAAQSGLVGATIRIARATGPITIDGNLSEEAWQHATRVDKWYEINPADNTEPKVRNLGYLAYDDRFLYAGFDFEDPRPQAIRAPLGDRDDTPSYTDYAGVILDTRHDGRTGVLLVANPRGIQYDSVLDDVSGNEDSSPDFYWESAARITPRGWTLELRIPFSSLRYRNVDPQTWGVLLYRNYPRDFRYQFMSAPIPRGSNCFICHSNTLVGLEHLPSGGHVVAAPYLNAAESARPAGDLGTPMVNGAVKLHVGLDVKWTPNADNAVDLTAKPDFSQIESDTAQIAANQRFALFFPEKRPFFLEGVELLSTPIQAVYTRTITSPRWGARATGKTGEIGYTVLVADDAGGGSAVIPGARSSTLANQDFASTIVVARARRDIGRSFVSAIFTDREAGSDGHNRVVGPDFQWRPSASEAITGQFLLSDTVTPNRPDLSSDWDGRSLRSHAAHVQWSHSTKRLDLFGQYKDVGSGFRAATGFVPQVGYRETYAEGGYTFHPTGLLSRVRTFLQADRQVDVDGRTISTEVSPGVGMDARWNSFLRFRYAADRVSTGGRLIPRQQFVYIVQVSPPRAVSSISLDGTLGQDIDFDNSRPGRGAVVNLSATLRPGNHVEMRLVESLRYLDVVGPLGSSGRLFTADVSRLNATWTFTARSFLRVIGQYVSTRRDPSLYQAPVTLHDGSFNGSVLFAYKLNWQSVLFVGYGDERALDDRGHLQQSGRELFVKVSHAFQR